MAKHTLFSNWAEGMTELGIAKTKQRNEQRRCSVNYVIQISPGMEDKTETMIREMITGEVCNCCFHPIRHVRKKFHGQWVDRHEKLLPGYVFIISNNIRRLSQELKKVPVLTKLLGREGDLFVPLSPGEVEWMRQIMDGWPDENSTGIGTAQEVKLSQVKVTKNDMVEILSGPLKNMEGRIKKIHLHKRIAEVEVDFMGRKAVIHLGVELVGKQGE